MASTRAGFNTQTSAPLAPAIPPTSAHDAARQNQKTAGFDMQAKWYVKHTDAHGKPAVSRWTTAQVLTAMKSNHLDATARVTRDSQEPFLPFAQVPEFASEAQKLVTRTKVKAKEQSLASQYEKLEKQYRRQKWWRLLARFRDGTLGMFGLILYLAVVVAIIAGALYGGYMLFQYLDARFHFT
jgi:serine/threonine-protein kinase